MAVIVSFAPGPEGETAVAEGVRRSEQLGRPLVVVCTLPVEEARERAQNLVAAVEGAIVVGVQEGEDAVEVILDQVEAVKADLLVIGLRRRRMVGKLVLGSSAQRLLLDAPVPVLAVKPE